MRPRDKHFEAAAIEALPSAGFTVSATGGVARVEKYSCGAELRKDPDARYQMTVLPCILMGGYFTRLWDAGYQKFLLTNDGRKFPALAEQLGNLHRFNEELLTALAVPAYYNEALGSTCQITTYDRVKGRPGDVPDSTVGPRPSSKH